MANEILYQCSNCGKAEQTRAALGVPDGMFYAGYRAHGDVLYCPDCVKTWKERNGAEYDEQYKKWTLRDNLRGQPQDGEGKK